MAQGKSIQEQQQPHNSSSHPRTRSVSNLEKDMQGRSPHDSPDATRTQWTLRCMLKTPRGHSAVTMDPWASSTWRKPWNKYHTPNKVTKGQKQICTTEDTQRYQSLTGTAGRQGHNGRSSWSSRPTKKYNPRALGLISGPLPLRLFKASAAQQNKKRRR